MIIEKMKLGIIISTSEPETVWNAYRLANFALNEKDNVKVFRNYNIELE